ncbi:MAG: hypothetical protein GEU98_07755 [Pseudonocardiaceae bacterium]|nr:hypothetical protein [Pseudonocardiaceae bacterium]
MREWVGPGSDFFRLCTEYRRSSWRWECQGVYHEPDEQEPIRQWREGHQDLSFMDGWVATIRRLRAEGKTFERVRMVTEPPTEYLRWMFSFTHVNIEAGEDIRWITEGRARQISMPEHDFYLFDDDRVAILHFGEHGVSGAEVTDDPEVLTQHQRWRDLVWPLAIPHRDSQYATATRSP